MSEPTRALSRYDGPRTTDDLHKYSTLLAGTFMGSGEAARYVRNDTLPAAFRGNPAAIAFAVEYGKALDVSPITALIGIHIVDGKPTASAGLISALVRRAGHKIRTWTEGNLADGTLVGITTIRRADDPEFEYRSEWTLGRAIQANLMRREGDRIVAVKAKSAWDTYPENMVKSRSITECSRDAAEDAILGVHYTPEELGVDVDEAGEPVYEVTTVGRGDAPRDPAPAPAPAPSPAPAPAEAARDLDEVAADEVDELALLILDSTTQEELMALWTSPLIAGQNARAQALVTSDADGVEITILTVFQHVGNAVAQGKADDLAAIRARFGLVEVVEGDDGEAGTPASSSPEGPQEPPAGSSAPETAGQETDAQGPPRAEGPNLRTLNLTADRMTAAQRDALKGYAAAWSLAPGTSEEDAAKLCSAIATGVIGDLIRATNGDDPDPVELISESQLAVAREVEEAREEQREAAGATPPEAPKGGKAAAAAEARRIAREAKEAGPTE